MFEVGDKVVHPHHGAGVVTRREARVVLGEEREYLTIHIPLTDLLLNVPADGAEAVGVRRVIGEDVLDDLARTLTTGDVELEGNWNRRFRRNRDKIKTGNVFEIAEVIRHLAVRDHGRGLSSGERQLYAQAKRLLASEVQYARGTDEDEALVWIEGVLESVPYEQVAEAAHLE
jgi:CarD family transcriptional regulator